MKTAYIALGLLGVAAAGYFVYRRSQGQPLLPGTQPPPPQTTLPLTKTETVLQQTINEVLNNPNPGSQPVTLKHNILLNTFPTSTSTSTTNTTTETLVKPNLYFGGFNGVLI